MPKNYKKIILLFLVALVLVFLGVFLLRKTIFSSLSNKKINPVVYNQLNDKKIGSETFSFAVIGDTKSFDNDPQNGLKQAVSLINGKNPDLTFVVGDLIQKCSDLNQCENLYNQWKQVMEPILPKTYEIVGNHDRTGGKVADQAWQAIFDLPTNGPAGFSKMVYSFDHANAHFVVLDTEKPREHDISSDQLDWLKKDLDQNKQSLTFVFFHEPAFPVGSKIGSSIDVHSANRDALWSILDSHNVTAVFAGHEHLFSRRLIDNSVFPGAKNKIYQFIVGNTDAPIDTPPQKGLAEYFNMDHTFALIKIDKNKITVELYDLKGNLVNSFDFNATNTQ